MRDNDLTVVDGEVGDQLRLAEDVLRGAGVAALVLLADHQQHQLVPVRHLHSDDSKTLDVPTHSNC